MAAIPLDFPIGPYGSNHSPDSVAAHRCPRVATEQLVLLSRRWSHPGAWAAASSQKKAAKVFCGSRVAAGLLRNRANSAQKN